MPANEQGQQAEPIRVMIVDDHAVTRTGLRTMVEAEDDMAVVGEASLASEAIAVAPALRPDVLVLDLKLPDDSGITVCRELRKKLPEASCLMLTTYATEESLVEAILAGASGFVFKEIAEADLVNAIRTVGNGGSMLDPQATEGILRKVRQAAEDVDDPIGDLSKRDRQLLELLGEGLTNREISEKMFLSEKTVKNYVSSLLGKLGVQRRSQAAALIAERKSRRLIVGD
ncbi:MAG: response regulator transcription factor [Candidatus Nanopelagicales bacterium]|nr:response regulator transcription factor [Candidatus Nanopelagicales bacterium]